MTPLKFDISEEDRKSTMLSLLINVLASQEAQKELDIEMLKIDNEDANRLRKFYEGQKEKSRASLIEYLYSTSAIVNIDKILEGSNPIDSLK